MRFVIRYAPTRLTARRLAADMDEQGHDTIIHQSRGTDRCWVECVGCQECYVAEPLLQGSNEYAVDRIMWEAYVRQYKDRGTIRVYP